jgi:hypothetical protein
MDIKKMDQTILLQEKGIESSNFDNSSRHNKMSKIAMHFT